MSNSHRTIVKTAPPAVKDASGSYTPTRVEPEAVLSSTTDTSIDDLLGRGLATIERILRSVQIDASTGSPSRNSVMNLKDCMGMLLELKEREEDLLDGMSPEELQAELDRRQKWSLVPLP